MYDKLPKIKLPIHPMPKVRPPAKSFSDDVNVKPEIVINDRNKMGLRDAYPNFVRSKLQIYYYQSTFDQIKDNGTVMAKVDSAGLGMLAVNLALVDECNLSIEEMGMNMEYKGDRKMILKRNPALDVLKDAQAAVRFYLKEFSMTPSARGKTLSTGVPPSEQDDGFDEV